MKVVFRGLQDYPEMQKHLIDDGKALINLAHNKDSHLADAISLLLTIQSSLQLKIDQLTIDLDKQKYNANLELNRWQHFKEAINL